MSGCSFSVSCCTCRCPLSLFRCLSANKALKSPNKRHLPSGSSSSTSRVSICPAPSLHGTFDDMFLRLKLIFCKIPRLTLKQIPVLPHCLSDPNDQQKRLQTKKIKEILFEGRTSLLMSIWFQQQLDYSPLNPVGHPFMSKKTALTITSLVLLI